MDSPASEACGNATVEESMLLCKSVSTNEIQQYLHINVSLLNYKFSYQTKSLI